VQDALELSEKAERVYNAGHASERLVDVFLKESLNVADINVELDEIAVKAVVTVLKEPVVLVLEFGDVALECLQDRVDVLKVVLLERLELLDGAEEVDKLGHTATEEVEAAEDLGR
jgi:hypothetical protein